MEWLKKIKASEKSTEAKTAEAKPAASGEQEPVTTGSEVPVPAAS